MIYFVRNAGSSAGGKGIPFLLREAADSQKAIHLIEPGNAGSCPDRYGYAWSNGVELIRFLKERYPSMVILAVSAYEDYEYVRSSLTLGAKDYLLKHQLTPQLFFQVLQDAVGPVESQIDGLCPLPSRADRIRQMLLNPPGRGCRARLAGPLLPAAGRRRGLRFYSVPFEADCPSPR